MTEKDVVALIKNNIVSKNGADSHIPSTNSGVGEVSGLDNSALVLFGSYYAGWHGYVSLLVCAFGVITNAFNIIVLSQKHLRTPINGILTWLAVSDMLTMVSYFPFAVHFYISYSPLEPNADKNSFGWMRYMLFHINFSATTHTISVWLGVVLAILRYRHIRSPAKGNLTRMRRLIRARVLVFLTIASSVAILIPNYLTNRLVTIDWKHNTTLYILEDLRLGTSEVRGVVLLNLWVYGIGTKLIPCVLMAAYGGMLLKTLRSRLKATKERQSFKITHQPRPLDQMRTTRMLLAIIVLFLLTELPQAVLITLSVTVPGFFDNVYLPLGDTMDIVALVNNAINFVLYCTMSQEFRKEFFNLFWHCRCQTQEKSSSVLPRERCSEHVGLMMF